MKRDIRQKKVGELLLRTLSQIINFEMWDPRIKNITIYGVKVSKDLKSTKVYIGCEDKINTLKVLNKATSFLKRRLKELAILKYIPEMKFVADDMEEKANRIDEILKDISQEK